jgi:hypothetical protein
MKKRSLFYLILIALAVCAFVGFRFWEGISHDAKAPEIRMGDEILELSVTDPQERFLEGISAVDNRDGDVTGSVVVEKIKLTDAAEGLAEVSLAAFDKSGNVAKFSRMVRYTDYHGPRFSLKQPLVYAQNSGMNVLDRICAEDVFDGDLSHHIRATSLSDTGLSGAGIHNVEFRVANSLGDVVKLVIPVEVRDYVISYADVILTEYLVYLQPGDSFQAKDYLNGFKLNQEFTSLSGRLPAGYRLETEGTVNTQVPGVYAVSYTVTYTVTGTNPGVNDRDYTGYSKLIVVVDG